MHSMGKVDQTSDEEILALLSRVQLTERLSAVRLARLQEYFPGPKIRETLGALADQSAFLELPESELPKAKTPDASTLATLKTRMTEYVQKMIPTIPNLSVSRQITLFENGPAGKNVPNEGLHRVRVTTDEVAYKGGHEKAKKRKSAKAEIEMPRTMGEFRELLETVIGDATSAEMDWSHWEQGTKGLQACSHTPFRRNGRIFRVF